MKQNDYSYFQNRDCEYFPCHKTQSETFNCLFCYCPLYALGDQCGGHFTYTASGIKDCSSCLIPHGPQGHAYITANFPRIVALIKQNQIEEEPK